MEAPSGNPLVRILIADDDPAARGLLRLLVEANPHFHVVAVAGSGNEAIEKTRAYAPDLVLMDLQMPYVDGLAATREIRKAPSAPKIIVITAHAEDGNVRRALKWGASAFITKTSVPEHLERVVNWVLEGKTVLDPEITEGVVRHLTSSSGSIPAVTSKERAGLDSLTAREGEVLRLIAQGLPNRDIGASLQMTEATVKSHVTHIMQKLDTTNRVQAAIIAHRAGMMPPES
ncbi:response regulator [Streptomyces albireticuli]|uniref:response regulator n=1 Tax=Streptomyces albireticuli TaxID=1940 RepID=UPI0036ADEAAC